MGKVAQIKTFNPRCGGYTSADIKEVRRALRDGCPPEIVAANYGMSPRAVRRLARRVGA